MNPMQQLSALPITPLTWAVIIFGVFILVLVIVLSRREKSVKVDRRGARVIAQPRLEMPDLSSGSEFDEFGVGRPRRAGEPRTTPPPVVQLRGESIAPEHRSAPSVLASVRSTESYSRIRHEPTVAPPAFAPAPRRVGTQVLPPREPPPPPPPIKIPEKIVTLLIAQREGGAIEGRRLHEALAAERLAYGPMQIYHRLHGERSIFSVANLLKPGTLNPAEAAGFSTLGLSMFLVLPGPVAPLVAFDDMVTTADRLAARLRAEVYDSRRQPLGAQAAQALRAEVGAWAAEYRV